MKRRRPAQLPDLIERNRNAATVYAALRWLSGERRQLNNTSRARIAEVCGLSPKVISAAIKALDECGWVTVKYGRSGTVTWYRLSFSGGRFFPVGRKTPHRERTGGSKNTPQRNGLCGSKNTPPLLTERGASYSPPSSPSGEGERPPQETRPESTAARIEREKMAQIRADREAGIEDKEAMTF